MTGRPGGSCHGVGPVGSHAKTTCRLTRPLYLVDRPSLKPLSIVVDPSSMSSRNSDVALFQVGNRR